MTSPAARPTDRAVASTPLPAEGSLTSAGAILARLQESIGREVIGYAPVVRALTDALLADGHVLLEGVPGLAKTYLVRSFARSLDLSFRRIQFTPDMLPADILGATVINPKDHSFEFRPGRSSPTLSSRTRSTALPRRSSPPCSRRCRKARSQSRARAIRCPGRSW